MYGLEDEQLNGLPVRLYLCRLTRLFLKDDKADILHRTRRGATSRMSRTITVTPEIVYFICAQ